MALRMAPALRSKDWARPTNVSASSLACAKGKSAPEPALISKMILSAPEANFFDKIELVIKGSESTVAVTSRKA